jgi:signal transduction histidine kinase
VTDDALRAENARLRRRISELEALIGEFHDGGERASERLLLFSGILEHMPVAYVRLDGDGRFRELVGPALARTDLQKPSMIGEIAVNPVASPVTTKVVTETIRGGPTRVFETHGRNGNDQWWYVNFITPNAVTGDGTLGFIVDVTPQKQAEFQLEREENKLSLYARELRQTNATLLETSHRAEIARSAAENAREAAEEASAAKTRFLANMSHELRTPLNAIIGYAALIQEDASDAKLPGCVEDAARINRAAQHLLGLINRLLDLTRIESGREFAEIQHIDLRHLVNEVAATVEPLVLAGRNSLTVAHDHNAHSLKSDETRLRQILFNLLSNSAKFTKGGEIHLEVDLEEGGNIRFVVRDTGVGMEPDVVASIFDPFYRIDEAAMSGVEGTGLGLAITRGYCELMEGSIELVSAPGEGTEFTVSLPSRRLIDDSDL